MAISNLFPFFLLFLLQVSFFKYLKHFQSAKKKKELGEKKVQIILQTSGKSIKEDMALLLAWCGGENRNVWSACVFCSVARPDLRNTFRERGVA